MNKKNKILENNNNQHTDDFYSRFKEKLEETHSFPTDYMFKYIIPAEQNIIAQLYSIFSDANPSFSTRDSKNGKYTSVTIKVPVNDAIDVVIYYRQVVAIEGVLAL